MNEEELIDRYLSASMSEEDKSELKRLFTEDVKFSDRFRTYVEETSIYISVIDDLKIRQAYELSNSKANTLKVDKKRIAPSNLKVVEPKSKKSAFTYIVALAAILAICASGAVFLIQKTNTIGASADLSALKINRSTIDLSIIDSNSLMKGDEIIALQNDVEVTLADGSILKMDKGASCVLDQKSGQYLIDQKRGRIEYEVQEQKGGKKFQVLTNGLRTTVIGTRFTVESSGAKEKVRVVEGLVKVDDFEAVSHFINPGEFAMINDQQILEKANAKTGMKLSELVKDYMGNELLADSLEEKPFLLVLQAKMWDPSSRAFVFKLKKFYERYKDYFEVIFVNDEENFAYDYEMPWPVVKKLSKQNAMDVLEIEESSFPLNMRLINQEGKIFARSVSANEWLGYEHVLDAIKSNTSK